MYNYHLKINNYIISILYYYIVRAAQVVSYSLHTQTYYNLLMNLLS